jgi:hypothetical protein
VTSTNDPLRTIEIKLSAEQRRSLGRDLTARMPLIIGITIIGGIVMAFYVRGVLGPEGGLVGPAAGAALAIVILGYLLVKLGLIRRETVALRSVGYFPVEWYEARFARGRWVRVGRRKVFLDNDIPAIKALGAVEYTKHESYALAIFDTTGAVRWKRAGYQTVTSAFNVSAGRVETA